MAHDDLDTASTCYQQSKKLIFNIQRIQINLQTRQECECDCDYEETTVRERKISSVTSNSFGISFMWRQSRVLTRGWRTLAAPEGQTGNPDGNES